MQTLAEATGRSTGEFRTPILLDRAAEAAGIVDFLGRPQMRLAVIFGHSNSGKSTLVRKFVMPAMPNPNTAFFGVVTPDLPAEVEGAAGTVPLSSALSSGATVFIDEFDQLLAAGGKKRMEEVGALFSQIHRGEIPGRLVVILQEDHLSQLLAFRSSAPDLLDNTHEVKPLPLEEHIRKLGAKGGAAALAYSPEVIDRLRVDLAELGASGSCDIAEAVDCGFRHYKSTAEDRLVTAEDYRDAGFLPGIVRGCLDARMLAAEENLGKGAALVTKAIADEVVEAARLGRAPDFQEIAPRLDVSGELADRVLAWAAGPGSLLATDRAGTLRLVPRELARILERASEAQRHELEQARTILQDGLHSKAQLGTLLPRDRFDVVNLVRARLKTTDEQTTLLVLSALQFQETPATLYWLRRIASLETRESVLIGALFSDNVAARLNAATLLADFDDPEVRGQLYRKALEDPEQSVRERAIESLSVRQTEEFWPLLEKEAKDKASPYRVNAIAAMRLCICERCVNLLKQIVDDPTEAGLRDGAIQTLAAMDLPAATDTLVAIGLDNEDAGIRRAAARSLASLRWPGLVARALETTRTATLKIDEAGWEFIKTPLSSTARLLLALVATVLNFFVHGLALLPIKRYRWAGCFFALEILWIALAFQFGYLFVLLWFGNWMLSHFMATSFVLTEGSRNTRMLRFVLFIFCGGSLMLVHGSANALIGRWRRAATLLAIELVGLALVGLAFFAFQDYGLGKHFLDLAFYSFFWFYLITGAGLFAASFWLDTKSIFYERCYLKDRGESRQRKADLIRDLLATPAGTQAALDMARGSDTGAVKWARHALASSSGVSVPQLIARFESLNGAVPKFLRRALVSNQTDETVAAVAQFWDRRPAEHLVRRNVLTVLLAEPSAESLRMVNGRLGRLGWWDRMRYRIATGRYAVRLWPITVRFAACLMIPFVIYALCEAILSVYSPTHILERHMRANLEVPRGRQLSRNEKNGLLTAEFLAAAYATDSASEIIEIYDAAVKAAKGLPDDSPQVSFRNALSKSLSILACASLPGEVRAELLNSLGNPRDIVGTFMTVADQAVCLEKTWVSETLVTEAQKLLDQPLPPNEDTRLAIKAWEKAVSVRALANFLDGPLPETRLRNVDMALATRDARRQHVALRMEAVNALIRIHSPDAFAALQSAMTTSRSREVRDQIASRLRSLRTDPLDAVETAFKGADYDGVIEEGTSIRNRDSYAALPAEQKSRLLAVLGEAKYRQSLDPRKTRTTSIYLENEALDFLVRSLAITSKPNVARIVAEIHNSRAERLRSEGKLRLAGAALDAVLNDALKEVAAGIAADRTFPEIYATKGAILLNRGKPDAALAEFAYATQLDPQNAWDLCMQAQIHMQSDRKDYDAAQRLATRAINASPDYSWSYFLLYESYTERPGDPLKIEAIKRFEELEIQYPAIYWPARQLANLYHDHWPGDPAEGLRKSYEKWLDLDKKFASKLDPATLLNHRANFLESLFTHGDYTETLRLGKELQPQIKEADYRIPVILLTYAAALIRADNKTALEELALTETALREFKPGQKAPWDYRGTKDHVGTFRDDLPWKKPLIALLDAAGKMREGVPIPQAVIQENKRVLSPGR